MFEDREVESKTSLSRRQDWKQGAGHRGVIWAGQDLGVELSLWEALCQPWQGYVWWLEEGFGCGVPSARSSCSDIFLPPSLLDGAALMLVGTYCSEGLRRRLPCSQPHQVVFLLWPRAQCRE